jgi:outer membrane protein assembly factor BamB
VKALGFKTDFSGGSGSVTVAGGRAFLFAHIQKAKPLKVRTEFLETWGWHPDMPDDLAKQVEEIRTELFPRHGRDRYPSKEEREAAIKKLLSSLEPAVAKKFEPAIRKRLGEGAGCSLEFLNRLASVRGQEFESFDALQDKAGSLMSGHGGWQGWVVKKAMLGEGHDYSDLVYCLDAETGETLWKKKFPGKVPSEMQIHWTASSTPTVSGDHCFVQGSAALYCFSVRNGDLVWKSETGVSNASPVVQGGAVFTLAPPGLTAYDAATGKTLWTLPGIENRDSSPVLWNNNGKTCIICFSGMNIVCIDASQGKVIWKTMFKRGKHTSSPIVVGDMLLAVGGRILKCYKLTPRKPQELWTLNRRGATPSSPVVYRGMIYFVGRRSISCIDLKTGAVKWNDKTYGVVSASPIAVDGKVIAWVTSRKDRKWHLIQFKADADAFELQEDMLPSSVVAFFSSPTVANGKLYVRYIDGVASYDLRK